MLEKLIFQKNWMLWSLTNDQQKELSAKNKKLKRYVWLTQFNSNSRIAA